MESLDIELPSLADTGKLGKLLGEIAEPGDVIILSGPLGAGKTAITQFIGAGLEVPADCYVTSPTFSLMHEYRGRLPLYHMDLYRLTTEEEIEELGFLDYIYGDGLTVIEWPARLGSLLPEEHLEIKLEPGRDENTRTARLAAIGNQWLDRLPVIRQTLFG
ncbi:MAG: tRNA (adenosine(37)-N6)-threonylcarbamoyltransferase complex ATPase subunit type 1 TsaE [Desulfobulbales bacterium]|nr:tRNA (adenosine(37)-N6)-threonylcarbamoyltransferase complex ATPase subunit type 1 TsaE [Desulfobulbales bacterium]